MNLDTFKRLGDFGGVVLYTGTDIRQVIIFIFYPDNI